MFLGFRLAPQRLAAFWPALVLLCAGCTGYSEGEAVAIRVIPPAGWRTADAFRAVVPGTPLAAWTGPQGASMVLYTALPVPNGTPEGLATDLANRLANLPGLKVVRKEVLPRGVARVDVVAPGTGDALAPTGTGVAIAPKGKSLVPTHRTTLAVLRARDTLWLTCHYPESAQAELGPQVERTMLSTLSPGSVDKN